MTRREMCCGRLENGILTRYFYSSRWTWTDYRRPRSNKQKEKSECSRKWSIWIYRVSRKVFRQVDNSLLYKSFVMGATARFTLSTWNSATAKTPNNPWPNSKPWPTSAKSVTDWKRCMICEWRTGSWIRRWSWWRGVVVGRRMCWRWVDLGRHVEWRSKWVLRRDIMRSMRNWTIVESSRRILESFLKCRRSISKN